MQIEQVPVNPRAIQVNARLEAALNTVVRRWDGARKRLRLGGRAAPYDDDAFAFFGGEKEVLRKKHYDKSLRLLWKAQQHLGWSSFKDCTADEAKLMEMGLRGLSDEEKSERKRDGSAEFRAFLDKTYSPEQKQAIVDLLAPICHGEAYAWLVSAQMLAEVQSTG